MELLVSMAVFLFLGITLVSVFRSGMDIWRSAEAKKVLFSRARNVLSIMRNDFSNIYMQEYPWEADDEVTVKCISDFIDDSSGEYSSQRIRFVRRLNRQLINPVIEGAGDYEPSPLKMYDQFDDVTEQENEELAAPGGLTEVGYLLKGETLYRGIKAPLDMYTEVSAGVWERVSLFNGSRYFDMDNVDSNARPLARNVLYYEVRFWASDTESWEVSGTFPDRKSNEASLEWDSTRVDPNSPEDFPFCDDSATALQGDPSDDVFPPKVQILLVVDSDRLTRELTRLVSEGTDEIEVTKTRGFSRDSDRPQFIKIGNEWIQYDPDNVEDTVFHVTGNGHGARQTTDVNHDPGAEIYQGRTFSMVVDIPGVTNE